MQSKYYISGSKDSDYYNPLLDKDYYEKVDEIEEKEKKDNPFYSEDKIFNLSIVLGLDSKFEWIIPIF